MLSVCILGSNGFIGSSLLKANPSWIGVARNQLDLTIQDNVDAFFKTNYFDVVIHCASVGGNRLHDDTSDVFYKNILMFENVVRNSKKFNKLVYFSSGASNRGNPPTDPYGLSKWIIDKHIAQLPYNVYSLCIWGCYGPGELETRFSAICKRDGHVVIKKDKYFDFVSIKDVETTVQRYVRDGGHKFHYIVPPDHLKLSEWATKFGATFDIQEEGLDEPYCH